MKKVAVLFVIWSIFGVAHAMVQDSSSDPSPIHRISKPADIVKALTLISEDVLAKRAAYNSGTKDLAIAVAAGYKIEKIEIYEGRGNNQIFSVIYTPSGIPGTAYVVERNANAYYSVTEMSKLK